MAYPITGNNIPTGNNTQTLGGYAGIGHSEQHNDIVNEINAVETEVGYSSDLVSTTLEGKINTGWVREKNTVAYSSSSSFLVQNVNQSSVYTLGRKVRITSNGATLYANVTSSSYSSPNTTVNVDISTINTPVTAVDYSFQPIGATLVNANNISIQSPTSSQLGGITASNLASNAGVTAGQLAVASPTSTEIGGLTTSNLSTSAGILGSQLATNPTFNGDTTTTGNYYSQGGHIVSSQSTVPLILDSPVTNTTFASIYFRSDTTPGNITASTDLAQLFGDGSFHTKKPNVLISGNQTTIHFHWRGTIANNSGPFVTIAYFNTNLTNAPSSMTLAGGTYQNVASNALTAFSYQTDSAAMSGNVTTANADTFVAGAAGTTVGN